jgi:Cu+-exporting ATPase
MFEKREKKLLTIDGMMCMHCASSVTKALESLDGVTAKVNLKKQTAAVTCSTPITDEALKRAVEEAGFTVTAIE